VVCNGKASEGLCAGPKLLPNAEKTEPCAIEEFGNVTLARLAALTMPPWNKLGCAKIGALANSDKRQIICFIGLNRNYSRARIYFNPVEAWQVE
jgi:hypothetical protein